MITVPKKDVLIVPFLIQFSLNLRSRLYNCFKKTLPQCTIKVIFQSKNCLSNLFSSLSALTCKGVNNNKMLAVKDHCLFFNHVRSFEDFSILMYESNPFKLLFEEALLVSRDKPLLNKQVKSISLQLF